MSTEEIPLAEESKQGKFILRNGGMVQVRANGGLAVFNSEDRCRECCECKPYILAQFIIEMYYGGSWDLRYYQGNKVARPNRYWRLTHNQTTYMPVYRGCVDANGKLVGLPDAIHTTSFKCEYRFVLEIGCKIDGYVHFLSGPDRSGGYPYCEQK